MKIQRLGASVDGDLHIFPDNVFPRVTTAVSGPFRDRWAAYAWIIEHSERRLSPEKRALWGEALQLAGGRDAEVGHALGLMAMVAKGRPRENILRAARPPLFWSEPQSPKPTCTLVVA